ncbi:DEAD/DEAH box helicase [Desulforhopalus singaporensis]|uniref:Superfamily II DNA and RNA helicase n=1 Tax=Desulforhopalus singaporensis TaxID=91360 RepID=A0A1H0NSB4_9BACT|nr:DEAD/DEAH box helicase [Desulforhopalus singaporensis]SDO95571.1 Superfamily II DNA and RNA helicase [Desulforhopalus singaporensis]
MSFNHFQFDPKINAGIAACGYTSPTPIQKEAIPQILAGHDVLGLAQTGTGKTAAFVLPLLQVLLQSPRKGIRALIVAPTRELAEQINENIIKMAKKTGLKSAVVYGGVGKQPQIRAIRNGVDILVACPGRLIDLLNEKHFDLRSVEVLVLDEADHMFDKGFLPDIKRIIRQLPKKRQSLVFSATMPQAIRSLAQDILHNPVSVQVSHTLPAATISHSLYQVSKGEKNALLKNILAEGGNACTLVFTRTKHKARSLAGILEKVGFNAIALQGNMSQSKRQQAMDGFRNGTYRILVATDIAARGIDVDDVSFVINYDMPDTVETYTHRTGRTGRANRTGLAMTFAEPQDMKMISTIERSLGKKISRAEHPPEALESKVKTLPAGEEQQTTVKQINRGKSRRRRACTFDFGVRKPALR